MRLLARRTRPRCVSLAGSVIPHILGALCIIQRERRGGVAKAEADPLHSDLGSTLSDEGHEALGTFDRCCPFRNIGGGGGAVERKVCFSSSAFWMRALLFLFSCQPSKTAGFASDYNVNTDFFAFKSHFMLRTQKLTRHNTTKE